jgi:hypothetical protein
MNDAQVVTTTSHGRRALMKGIAWSAPVLITATLAPATAASTPTDVGNFSVDGDCGVLGLLGPGFEITAGDEPLPTGTVITVTGTGVANIGVFSLTGGTARVDVLSPGSRQIVLTAPLPAGATLEARTTLSITVAFGLTATATLPDNFNAGPSAKPTGNVSSTLVLCSDS